MLEACLLFLRLRQVEYANADLRPVRDLTATVITFCAVSFVDHAGVGVFYFEVFHLKVRRRIVVIDTHIEVRAVVPFVGEAMATIIVEAIAAATARFIGL